MTSPRSTPPPLSLTAGTWREFAACRGHRTLPATTWDDAPPLGQREGPGGRKARIADAKAVCETECPVREQCLADVDLDYDEGIRGGKDIRDLKAARRRNRNPKAVA